MRSRADTSTMLLLLMLSGTVLAQQSGPFLHRISAHYNGQAWERTESYTNLEGYGRRPDDGTFPKITVYWEPLKRDALGNLSLIRGRLQTSTPGGTKPINWFQGVTVYLARIPGKTRDWAEEILDSETASQTLVIKYSGEFETHIHLDEIESDRKTPQSFQIGLALATHAGDTEGQTVVWSSATKPIPTSVCHLTLPPAAPLPHAIELINRASRWPPGDDSDGNSTAVDVIRAVNALRLLGKEQALATIEKYVEMVEEQDAFGNHTIVFWLVRLLFDPEESGQFIDPPRIPIHLMHKDSPDAKLWPLNPIELVNDVPYMVGWQVNFTGGVEHPSSHITWARRYGVIRTQPLSPTSGPLAAAETLLSHEKFKKLDKSARDKRIRSIREQALATMPEHFQPMPPFDRKKTAVINQATAEYNWKAQLAVEQKLRLTWDQKLERFVTISK